MKIKTLISNSWGKDIVSKTSIKPVQEYGDEMNWKELLSSELNNLNNAAACC